MKNTKKLLTVIFSLAIAAAIFTGCDVAQPYPSPNDIEYPSHTSSVSNNLDQDAVTANPAELDIPAYTGDPYVAVNNNVPFFEADDLTTEPFETYASLDALGRCGVAYANLCTELMPTEDRESISEVKPSGWINKPYDNVDGGYLYNRCHLIGFQLAGENANEKNLITGTRYMNVEGMLPFENMVADFLHENPDLHVLYRVTPIFSGTDLVARGVLMEAKSVEDNGAGILFNVYCYNVQPGISIDYATGDNWAETETDMAADSSSLPSQTTQTAFVLNNRSMKFHLPTCSAVDDISTNNREDVMSSRDKLLDEGYSPCGICNP